MRREKIQSLDWASGKNEEVDNKRIDIDLDNIVGI